jgi:hypothetical protein
MTGRKTVLATTETTNTTMTNLSRLPIAAPPKAAKIAAADWRPIQKGESLQGSLSLELPSGIKLFECTYHRRADGRRWVGLPARSYEQDGERRWVRLVGLTSREAHERFQRQALEAVDVMLGSVAG